MNSDDFAAILRKSGYAFKRDKSTLVVTHQGSVYLTSLTALPEGVRFENNGSVYLTSLTALPKGVKFENHGHVYLPSLTGEHTYRGEPREFRYVDG